MSKVIDLTDKQFGNLTVLGLSEKRLGGKRSWDCKCSCGNIITVTTSNLNSGNAISCGCARKKSVLDLVGKKFNKLTVLSYGGGYGRWKCKCDCGNETIVRTEKLTHGYTKSCGCSRIKPLGERALQKNSETVQRLGKKAGFIQLCGCVNITTVGNKAENEVRSFMENYVYTEKNREVLGGQEIDVYVPSLRLGIEYNGSAYHASTNGIYKDLPKLYHRNKFLLAKEKGVHLISIFDVDWENNKDKIKMYLSSLLTPQKKLMARKCEVKVVDNDIACDFVDKYHIQGSNKMMMKINYGLYYDNELMAVMSFGKLRLSKTTKGQYELHRYCVKDGYTIVGGAGKLLKAFEKEYQPSYILSYSDNDYFLGGIYERLGFTNKGQCRPRYYWYLNGQEIKRERCMLKHLKVLYPDLLQEAYDIGASNKEDYVMLTLGAYKVYRSGNTKWEK